MIAIKSQRLITDAARPPILGGIVLVEGERIAAIGVPPSVTIPPACPVIDCTSETVMPGLVDSHIHITANSKYRIPLKEQHTMDLTTAVLRGSMNLRSDMAAGVTTARSLGDVGDVELRFRGCIDRGEIPGPRLVIAIRALRPSHGTAQFLGIPADGPEQLRRMIRENFAMGARVVKLFVTNVMNGATDEDYRRGDLTGVAAYSREELTRAIGEAHDLGMKVAGHAIGGPGMRWAMEAGIDSVEHANLIEEQDLEYFVKYRTVLSDPNLQLFFDTETGFESRENWKQPWWREKVVLSRELSARWIPVAIRAGVKVALATDSTHGMLWKEPKYLVQIGATPEEALLALTKNSAGLLGMSDEIGTLEPGKFADIISVRGDPLADITVLKNVNLVMKGGRRFERLLQPDV